jgi:hypothetical protein
VREAEPRRATLGPRRTAASWACASSWCRQMDRAALPRRSNSRAGTHQAFGERDLGTADGRIVRRATTASSRLRPPPRVVEPARDPRKLRASGQSARARSDRIRRRTRCRPDQTVPAAIGWRFRSARRGLSKPRAAQLRSGFRAVEACNGDGDRRPPAAIASRARSFHETPHPPTPIKRRRSPSNLPAILGARVQRIMMDREHLDSARSPSSSSAIESKRGSACGGSAA